jgi:sarcosine oxidase subunit gamma
MVEPRAPLAHRADDLARVDAVEVPFLSQLDVRCGQDDAARLGFPLAPNTYTGDTRRAVLWLAPDEWLVVGTDEGADPIDDLFESLAGSHHAIVDVSANRAVIELRGDGRSALLATGCSLDIEPEGGWVPGSCAQTLFARAQVILQELPEATRLFVRPSFGDYVVDRLVAASTASTNASTSSP